MATAKAPELVVPAPSGWVPVELPPPRLGEATTLSSYGAVASPAGDARLVRGCVAAAIPGWVEDMRPAVEARTTGLLGAAAEKATGLPMDARPAEGQLALRPTSRLGDPPTGAGRILLGFDDGHVYGCFVACVARPPAATTPEACPASVAGAALVPALPPPPPGLVLGGVDWAVHHPAAFAEGAGLAVALGILAALVLRPRPRTRILREK